VPNLLLGVLGKDGLERIVTPDGFPIRIGRGADNDLVLPDRSVSRHHCTLVDDAGTRRVIDHGSSNGTLVNGRAVEDEVLRSGDLLRVGSVDLLFLDVAEDRVPPGDALRLQREENRDLWKLLRLNREILRETERPRLLRKIVDTAVALTRAERGFLVLFEGEGLAFATARDHRRRDIERPRDAVSAGILREVRESGRPVCTTDAAEDPRFEARGSVVGLMLRSVVCVPLRLGASEVLGGLYIDNRIRRGAFTTQDARLLSAFADLAALAIRNTEALAESRRREAAIRRSHEAIRRLNLDLRAEVDHASEQLAMARDESGKPLPELRYPYRGIIGRSPAMQKVFRLLDRVIDSSVPILLVGESGTGKELIARVIHSQGPRKEARFVSQNCAAIPPTLLDSELFGHEKGAFTGAEARSPGLFETAHGGTLFLDEVGDMSPEMQKRLLRVLQEGEIRKVGGSEIQKIDVRLISATNRHLEELKDRGLFREDLYYRLNVVQVSLPPLRERREDIPILVDAFLEKIAREAGTGKRGITQDALQGLMEYAWPGNVRELENEIRKAVALSEGEIGLGHLSARIRGLPATLAGPAVQGGLGDATLRDVLDGIEADLIRRALEECGWNRTRAAKRLGLSRPGLRKKMERLRVEGEGPGRGAGSSGP